MRVKDIPPELRKQLGKRKQRHDRVAKTYSLELFDAKVHADGSWVLWLPWPPSNNVYWRRYGNATTIGPDGKAYRKAVCSFFKDKLGVRFGDKRLSMSMTLYAPSKRRFDLSNYWKCIEDSLVHAGVFDDDSQIDEQSASRGMVIPGHGRVVVTIREANKP